MKIYLLIKNNIFTIQKKLRKIILNINKEEAQKHQIMKKINK